MTPIADATAAPHAQASALRLVCDAGLPDDVTLRPLTGGASALTWAVCHASSASPLAVVKLTQQFAPRALAEAAALQAARDVPHLPRLLHVDATPPHSGLVMSWLGDAPVGLDVWLQDASPQAAAQAARALGEHLARLHEVVVRPGSDVKRADDPMAWGPRQLHQLRRVVRRAQKRVDDQDALDLLNRAVAHVAEALPRVVGESRPMRLIHRDMRPANALVHTRGAHADALAGLIDLERACAGDPAWDLVKLQWWLLDPHPALAAPLQAGYETIRPWPDPARARLYTIIEAASMLATFHGAHPDYPALAISALCEALGPPG